MTTVFKDIDHEVYATRCSTRWQQLGEVAVFLFLILPSISLSFFAVRAGNLSFPVVAVSTILRDLGLVALIVFFLWRCGEVIKMIGWTFGSGWREILLGALAFVPIFFAAGFLEGVLVELGFTVPSTPVPSYLAARTYTDFVIAFLLVAVVALAEETIFRGYLIFRLRGITGSTGLAPRFLAGLAVAISAGIFTLGHGYEGSAGLITVGFLGLAFSLVYLWRRSLVAPVVMHFLQDFLSIVLIPLLGMR